MEIGGGKCEEAEREPVSCGCEGRSLKILQEVQRAYEEKMAIVERIGGSKTMQMQVEVLRSWVGDLVGQNSLLARAVEDLEAEATSRLMLERCRHSEIVSEIRAEGDWLRRRLARREADLAGVLEVLRRLREFDRCSTEGIQFFDVTESDIFGKVDWSRKSMGNGDSKTLRTRQEKRQELSRLEGYRHFKKDKKRKVFNNTDMKSLNDKLQKENVAKDREIRRLNKDVQQYEQTIITLRNEMSAIQQNNTNVQKKDAEVMASLFGAGNECGDWEPVRECRLDQDEKYQERMNQMESDLKESSSNVRCLREMNVSLGVELAQLRRVCGALHDECRDAARRTHFGEDIIREMRNQLKQAKKTIQELSREQEWVWSGEGEGEMDGCARVSVSHGACVRHQPRRSARAQTN